MNACWWAGPISAIPPDILAEIDARHLVMRAAFQRRDLAAYADCLADTVEYVRVDGTVGDRDAMLRETAAYFSRLVEFVPATTRTSDSFDGEIVRESLDQVADTTVVAFVFVRRRYRMDRKQDLDWVRQNGAWRVRRVATTLHGATPIGWGWGRVGATMETPTART